MAQPSLLLFGPQTTLPSPEQFAQLRQFFRREALLQKFYEAAKDLPNFWKLLTELDPSLEAVEGLEATQAIAEWLETGDLRHTSSLSNVLRTPLTVILHIIQYFQYLTTLPSSSSGSKHHKILKNSKNAGIQGLCTGLLSSISIACAKDESDVSILGASALRLAVCIGAYVDLDGCSADKSVCLTVRWRSEEKKELFMKLMTSYPEAYISLIFDDNNITVTIPRSNQPAFSEALAQNDILSKLIEVEGRFHSSTQQKALEKVTELCNNLTCMQLPSAESLIVPVKANVNGRTISQGSLSQIVAASLLTDISDWQCTISATTGDIAKDSQVTTFGFCDVMPASIVRSSNFKITRVSSLPLFHSKDGRYEYPESAVAIVGMGCKYAGADSLDEFWKVIREGASMCAELPRERWPLTGLRRTKNGSRYWGNFIRDPDAFDHAFFKKSSREAAAMDPQQRLLLQVAYHAVESSGFFGEDCPPEDIGCYIGVATTDYHDNIASHPVTAFSALGELRAFLCGRISYQFGWTGPSLTYDTACSSSMVAIDAACKAIQSGHCVRALAGGVSVNTSPNLWENLRGANFLSPTGATKPFDAKADGYCRGEGVGLVFLKKLSAAIQDGDFVLGVIAGSGVNQCKNESYITVPYGPSQVQLYKKALQESCFKASDISFVEAHGTGTQAGDPVEIESIRQVFGGTQRKDTLHIGSVKGNIGHCEASSGVASLIKTVLMIQKELIPPLASHQSLNPKIPSLESSNMAISRSLKPWKNSLRATLVSNYGAAGNNAAVIVGQPLGCCKLVSGDLSLLKVPIFISAQTENSLAAYSKALKSLIAAGLSSPDRPGSDLANLAYNLAQKSNRSLKYSLITTATSLADLTERLDTCQLSLSLPAKPVVLVFGGQINNYVGLSEILYRSSTLFRRHLDHCNEVMRAAGLKEIFPTIFQKNPVMDVVNLHCMFFAIQYACAKSWMESGVRPAAIIGHSFGQLSGMCLSGCLSLEDSIKLVAGRATLMQQCWGEEAGSMISLEADIDTVSGIISTVSELGFKIETACYNGPISHVVVGTAKAMDIVEEIITDEQYNHRVARYKRLNVTHGFHSQFTEPLLPGLIELAAQLKFTKSTIPLETCSTKATWEEITPTQIAEHTRTAVYFQEAVERIASRFGSCTWLEAGSNSSVTGMVRRALGSSTDLGHSYQAIKLGGDDDVLGGLADATTNLWKLGHKVQFWSFHRSQSNQYRSINLPPYKFEKNRHWLIWKDYVESGPAGPAVERDIGSEKFELLKLASREQNRVVFIVDPRSEEFKIFVQGHAVLEQPLCPADLYVELASKAALQLMPDQAASYIPSVEKLSIIAPLGLDPSQTIMLLLTPQQTEKEMCWEFWFTSQARANPQKSTSHTSGQIILARSTDQNLALEFQRYERLICSGRAMSLLAESDSEGMQGNLVYKSFSRVVNYAKYYQGVKRISSKSDEVAAQITMPQQENKAFANALMDPVAVDNFIQVAGIKVNCLNACPVGQVYICGYIEKIQASKEFIDRDPGSRSWTVVANCTPMGEKDYLNDVYVLNENKRLAMLILGVRFTRVAIVSLGKAISAASAAKPTSSLEPTNNSAAITKGSNQERRALQEPRLSSHIASAPHDTFLDVPKPDHISSTMRNLLNKVADVPLDSITNSSKFEDLSIDSLMSTEILAEINQTFNVEISAEQFQDLQDLSSLSSYLVEISGVSPSQSLTSSPPSTMNSYPIVSSPSSSIAEEPQASSGNPVAKLAKLVAEQLEISVTMTADICLGDYGLDSLMGVQLANDIEEAFGVSLDSRGISPEITFGKLAQKVLPPSKSGPRSQPSSMGAMGNMQRSKLSDIPCVFKDVPPNAKRMPGDRMKTVLFKQAGPTALFADIYLPDPAPAGGSKRPIALMIHGGGHTMLSRKNIRPRQTELLLANGLLPVSIDYRLCPEINIVDGPMTDVCDALKWARTELPDLELGVPGLVVDAVKVVVVGWSTGGTLSLTLGFTAVQRGVKPPDATLAFYCPSDYEADFWKQPNYPENTQGKCPEDYDLLEGVQDNPITAYNVDPRKGAIGGWMSLSDPRSRIVLHMNWKGQALPILLNCLPRKASVSSYKSYLSLPQPPKEKIIAISPYAQIIRGNYRVPTYLIHGTKDDLVPWQQMKRTHEALREKGVPTGLGLLEGAVHLFDLYSGWKEREWAVVTEGYNFLLGQLRM